MFINLIGFSCRDMLHYDETGELRTIENKTATVWCGIKQCHSSRLLLINFKWKFLLVISVKKVVYKDHRSINILER